MENFEVDTVLFRPLFEIFDPEQCLLIVNRQTFGPGLTGTVGDFTKLGGQIEYPQSQLVEFFRRVQFERHFI